MRRICQNNTILSVSAAWPLEVLPAMKFTDDQQSRDATKITNGASIVLGEWVRQYKPTVVSGIGTSSNSNSTMADNLRALVQLCQWSPAEALASVTGTPSRSLLSLHRASKVGVAEEGAPADLLVVEGNPVDNISVMQNVRLVIKDGQCYKFQLKDGSLQVVTYRVGGTQSATNGHGAAAAAGTSS